jgi:hypothetical protein
MNRILIGSVALFLLMAGPLPADQKARQVALSRMGELNGVALACRRFEQTRRIKQALIETLPKQRELGQAFDDDTNDSFMAFVNSGKPCPSPAEFGEQVEEAVEALRQAYPVSN